MRKTIEFGSDKSSTWEQHDALIRLYYPRNKQNITESVFYKFLARFSGRRRNILWTTKKITSMFITLLVIAWCSSVTDACSSRTTPKPRPPPPPPTPSSRPNITFHTYKCPPTYAAWYCLNDATCFTVKIGDEILYNCECADGYMGPRCEYKDRDGTFFTYQASCYARNCKYSKWCNPCFYIRVDPLPYIICTLASATKT